MSVPPDKFGSKPPLSHRPLIRLHMNENPYDVPPIVKDEVFRRIAGRPWCRFPEPRPTRLMEKLAAFNNWNPEGILVGNGSTALMKTLLSAVIQPETKVLIPESTVATYLGQIQALGAELIGVPLTEGLQFNAPKLCSRAVALKTDLVVICSPNNPTGCVIAESDLLTLLKTFHGLVVIDEAYYEFSGKTFAALLKEYSNLIILRTFSKALGMAGLRIGYLMASPQIIRDLSEVMPPYSVNFFSTTAAEVCLDLYEHLQALVEKIISQREQLYEQLRQIKSLEPIPSHANFLAIRSSMHGQWLTEALLTRDIQVFDLSPYPKLSHHVRVAVGTSSDNDRLIAALKEIFSG